VLLEREGELGTLRDLVAGIADGRGATMLLEAPAGLGKSTLLDAAASLAAERGVTVRRARAHELEREIAWGVARSLFEDADDELLDGPAAAAGRLLRGDAGDTGFAILHGLYWVAARLSARAPLLLIVDDAQWADEPSLRFLLYLLGRLESAPLGVLAAARPSEDPLLAQLAGDPEVTVREPAPLGRDAVATLVGDENAERCFELTGGNPLRLRELLASLERGDELESSLTRTIRHRLAQLSPSAQALAHAVAVLEDDAPHELAAALAGFGDGADELRRADILRAGEPLGFTHPLVRAAVYAGVVDPPAEHARAAALLDAAGAPPERVCAHLLESAPAGDEGVVATLQTAAQRAIARGAPGSAYRYLQRALQEPPANPKDVHAAAGRAAALLAKPEALEHMEAAIALMDDSRERARLLGELGHALHHRGSRAAAAEAFTRGREELTERDDLALELEAGYLTTALLFPELAAGVHERLGELMVTTSTPAERTLASKVMLGRMLSGEDRTPLIETARELWGGGRLLEEGGADTQALAHVAGTLGACDDFAMAEEVARVAIENLDRRGWPEWSHAMRAQRARHRAWTGPIDAAIEDARRALDVFRGADVLYVPAAGAPLVRALLDRDEPEEAEAALALIDAHIVAPGFFAAWRHDAAARLHAYRGEHAQAREAWLACGEAATRILATNPAIWPWRSGAARATGAGPEAIALAAEELALAERFGAPRAIGVAHRALGVLTGDPAHHRAAVGALERSGARVEYAEALLTAGDYRQAIAVASAIGATRIVRLAEEGLRPARSDRLTPAERRVAELAAAGRSNREIAAELSVSAKSVEWHLGNVYRKLGIRGRAELPR
jgi:DNA-binding CsgD family transcriptional regulator